MLTRMEQRRKKETAQRRQGRRTSTWPGRTAVYLWNGPTCPLRTDQSAATSDPTLVLTEDNPRSTTIRPSTVPALTRQRNDCFQKFEDVREADASKSIAR